MIQEYRDGQWITDYPPESEWDNLEVQAQKLIQQGAFESDWDNHDTARGLQNEADSLRRKISIARNVAWVVW